MRKKLDIRIVMIVILLMIFIGMIVIYNKTGNTTIENKDEISMDRLESAINNEDNNSSSKITGSGEIVSGLTEKIGLHATYYYSERYIEDNKQIQEGENILKYTNGEYFVAPYDCIITSVSLPEQEGQCTNEHYVELAATNILEVSFQVSETNINSIQLGQDAKVTVKALEETLTGYVTNISSTANNGYFTATVEFENDGNIKLGMSASIEIAME